MVWRARAETSPTPDPGPAPVVVAGPTSRFDHLAELIGASDAVVIARVTEVERGEAEPTAATSGEQSGRRLVHLEVEEALTDFDPGDSIVLVEKGWDADGAPLLVDGAPPSGVGDHGIYFLRHDSVGSESLWTLVNSQGRYLADPTDGSQQLDLHVDDPLVHRLQAQDPAWLRHQIAAAASSIGRSPMVGYP